MKQKTVAFATLGCKMNQADTQAMRAGFEGLGFSVVAFGDEADVYVVNTCTVTGAADHQCRQLLRRALRMKELRPGTVVVAAGCYAQTDAEGLLKLAPGIDVIAGTVEKEGIAAIVSGRESGAASGRTDVLVGDVHGAKEFRPAPALDFRGRTRAYLRVQDGCDNRCSYCIVPFARGPGRSLRRDEALRQARNLAGAGYKEIVVTGIHAGSYGHDLNPRASLAGLLRGLHETPGLERIRVSSLDPNEFTDELFDALAALPRICPHFHISLQSGDERILRLMRRSYSPGRFAAVADRLRAIMPDVCIGADVITGFPTEDEDSFRRTYEFIEGVRLSYLHIFRYSPRPGTAAVEMAGQVPEEVKKARGAALHGLRAELVKEFRQRFIGRTMDVLFETPKSDSPGMLSGLTGNYLRVIASGPETYRGSISSVKVTGISSGGLEAEIL